MHGAGCWLFVTELFVIESYSVFGVSVIRHWEVGGLNPLIVDYCVLNIDYLSFWLIVVRRGKEQGARNKGRRAESKE